MPLSLWTSPAAAHPAPFSYLDLRLGGPSLAGSLLIHDFDAAHELGLDNPGILLDPKVAGCHRQRLVEMIGSRMRIIGDDLNLPLIWGAMEVLPDRQSVRLDMQCDQPVPAVIQVQATLFPYDPNHQTFINVYENEGLRHQAILNRNHTTMDYYAGTVPGRLAVLRTFVRAGIHHLLIGPDHILFLLGLLLLGGSFWRLAGIVSAFTLGHSVTLAVATLGMLTLPASFVEPAIALSIIVVGADNLLYGTNVAGRSRRTRQNRPVDLRPWLGAVFGLIHGFGLASVLKECGLPRSALAGSLLSFNLGVEIGQLLIVAIALCLLAPVRRSAVIGGWVTVGGSIGVVVAGSYWFTQCIWLAAAGGAS